MNKIKNERVKEDTVCLFEEVEEIEKKEIELTFPVIKQIKFKFPY